MTATASPTMTIEAAEAGTNETAGARRIAAAFARAAADGRDRAHPVRRRRLSGRRHELRGRPGRRRCRGGPARGRPAVLGSARRRRHAPAGLRRRAGGRRHAGVVASPAGTDRRRPSGPAARPDGLCEPGHRWRRRRGRREAARRRRGGRPDRRGPDARTRARRSKPSLEPSGLAVVYLVAPTTSPARRAWVASRSGGFLYCVSLVGVTGARTSLPSSVGKLVREVKAASPVPVAVGFGVSKPAHVRAIAKAGADGVIVASALVDALGPDGRDVAGLSRLVGDLRAARAEPDGPGRPLGRDDGPGRARIGPPSTDPRSYLGSCASRSPRSTSQARLRVGRGLAGLVPQRQDGRPGDRSAHRAAPTATPSVTTAAGLEFRRSWRTRPRRRRHRSRAVRPPTSGRPSARPRVTSVRPTPPRPIAWRASWRRPGPCSTRSSPRRPPSLRKGPRGGGRDRDKVVEHVLAGRARLRPEHGPEAAGARPGRLGLGRVRCVTAIAAVLREPSDGSPIEGRKWNRRYAARRVAWHVLDHAWEIEDRSDPA